MKTIFKIIIVLTVLAGTGCVPAQSPSPDLSRPDDSTKATLVREAEQGSVPAMLQLNKDYGFPGTAQGVKLFTRWNPALAQKTSPQNLTMLADVYMESRDMLINWAAKARSLYKSASDQGFAEADIKWISLALEQGNFTQVDLLEKKVLPSLGPKSLEQLYNIYLERYDCVSRRSNIARIMAERGYVLPIHELEQQMDAFNGDSKKIAALAEKVAASNRPDIMPALANYLKRQHEYTLAVKLLEAAEHQDPSNGDINMALYRCYEVRSFIQDRTQAQKKQMDCLVRGAENGNIKPAIKLLEFYRYRWESYKNDHAKLVAKLKETAQGRVALGRFYMDSGQIDQALAILEKEGARGEQNAILALALMPEGRSFNPEAYAATEQWRLYILSGNNFHLWRTFVQKEVETNEDLSDFLKSIGRRACEIEDIPVLRLLYEKYRYSSDEEAALTYLERATEAGDVKSTLDLADLKLDRPDHMQEGIDLLVALGETGCAEGFKRLGQFFHSPPYKSGIKKDEKRSIAYYKRAAELGDVETLISLGEKFVCPKCNPLGLISAQEGLSYLNTAAALGQADANYYLGWYYNYSTSVPHDLKKAEKYFELSLSQGNEEAYNALAHLYYGDNVIRKDDVKALSYIKKGSQANISECTNLLGIFYLHGYGGLKQDEQKAASLFKKVAGHNPYAATNLGEYYIDKKEYAKARKQLESAVKSDLALAQRKLGFLYQTGKGGKPEIKKALNLYLKAYEAEPNDETAFNIGLIYIAGEGGIKKDTATAKTWLKRSNFPEAKKWLKSLETVQP